MYSEKNGGGAPKGILSPRTCVRNVQTFILFLNTIDYT
jgi:hypothetical protein